MSDRWVRLQHLIYRNRSIAFTPAGTRFILLTLAVGVAAMNTGNNLLYLIVGMMLSLIIVSGLLSEQSLGRLLVEWSLPSRIFAGRPAEAKLRITNARRRLPSYSFRVEPARSGVSSSYVFKLRAGESLSIRVLPSFRERGRQDLPNLALKTAFPFGFIIKTLLRKDSRKVLVYPRILPAPDFLAVSSGIKGGEGETHRRGTGRSLYGLRDYTFQDDARGIHWKASARESKLLLKEFEREDEARFDIVLSDHVLPGTEEDFERAIMLAASLAVDLGRQGRGIRLRTEGAGEEAPGPLTSVDDILRALALLRPFPYRSPEEIQRRIGRLADSLEPGPRRILILSVPDPAWDPHRSLFAGIFAASDHRIKAWEKAGGPQ